MPYLLAVFLVQDILFCVQCNLDLVTLNLVTTCDLVTILQRPFFNLLHKSFDIVTLCDLVTVFAETKSVTKLRLHCNMLSFSATVKYQHATISVKREGEKYLGCQ